MKDLRENLEPEDLEELGLKLGEKKRLKKFLDRLHKQDISELSPGQFSILYSSNLNLIVLFSCIETGLNLNCLKDVFWEVRAKWYLLGIQLDVDHSDLEVCSSYIHTSCQYRYSLLLMYGLAKKGRKEKGRCP